MKYILPVILILLSSGVVAQHIELINGSLKLLKGQTSYGIRFTYDSMLIGQGKTEAKYLEQKKLDWERKEPGSNRGSEFVKLWFEKRSSYEEAFVKSFEGYTGIKLNDSVAPYTLIVKTERTEGGWTIGVGSHPGEIDGEMWVVESTNNEKVIARIAFYGVLGDYYLGGDFDMMQRIKSAYKRAGVVLGHYLRKRTKGKSI